MVPFEQISWPFSGKVLHTVRSKIQSLGWVNGVLYLLAVILSRLSRGWIKLIKYHFVVQPLGKLKTSVHRGRNIEVCEIKPGDPRTAELVREQGVIESRYIQGARCLAAIKKDEVVGFLWFTEGPYREDEVRSLFQPLPEGKAVWDFDVYVAPHHRLSPVFVRLWQEASLSLMARSYTHTCSRISTYNAASLSSHRRLGGETVGWGLYLCLGELQIAMFSCRPYVHFSLGSHSIPEIKVGPVSDTGG